MRLMDTADKMEPRCGFELIEKEKAALLVR
jgi:hypothetical protein